MNYIKDVYLSKVYNRNIRNGLFSSFQALFNLFCLLLVYRIAVQYIGLEQLGVWALLAAVFAFVEIGNISGTGTLSRYLPIAIRENNTKYAFELTHTVIITSVGIYFVLGGLFWLLAPYILVNILEANNYNLGIQLIPWLIAGAILNAISAGISSGIDGMQRADQRAILNSISAFIYLLLGYFLIPALGIYGIIISNITRHLFVLIVGWLLLKRHVNELGYFPTNWRFKIFKETTIYTLKLRAISLVGLFFDPLTKLILNELDGPSVVALYDVARRIVTQVRGLAGAAVQPLIAVFSSHDDVKSPESIKLLNQASNIVFVLSFLITTFVLISSPFISYLILNKISYNIISIIIILNAGQQVTLISQVYFIAAHAHAVFIWNFIGRCLVGVTIIASYFVYSDNNSIHSVLFSIMFGLWAQTAVVFVGNAYSFNDFATLRSLVAGIISAILGIIIVSIIAALILQHFCAVGCA